LAQGRRRGEGQSIAGYPDRTDGAQAQATDARKLRRRKACDRDLMDKLGLTAMD
jgi:hypothetical protein